MGRGMPQGMAAAERLMEKSRSPAATQPLTSFLRLSGCMNAGSASSSSCAPPAHVPPPADRVACEARWCTSERSLACAGGCGCGCGAGDAPDLDLGLVLGQAEEVVLLGTLLAGAGVNGAFVVLVQLRIVLPCQHPGRL